MVTIRWQFTSTDHFVCPFTGKDSDEGKIGKQIRAAYNLWKYKPPKK